MEQLNNPTDRGDVTLDDLECPICGERAVVQFWPETAEEQIDCYCCGYTRAFAITNLASKDTQQDGFGWTPQYAFTEHLGFGAYAISMLNSDEVEVGGFATEQSEQHFIDTVESMKDQIAYAHYTKYEGGKVVHVVLINTVGLPPRNQEMSNTSVD